jgi:hypothetical protein
MTAATATGLKRELRTTFEDTLGKVAEALKTEGFGVLTEIDVRDTLRKKLDVDFRRYYLAAVTRTVTVPKSTPESPGDERRRKRRGVCALFPAKPQDLPANPRAYLGVHVQKLNGGAANVRKTQDPSVVRRPSSRNARPSGQCEGGTVV